MVSSGSCSGIPALTTTMWVITRAHDCPAHRRSSSPPPAAAGLASFTFRVIHIAHLSDGGHADVQYSADFAGGQSHQRVSVLTSYNQRRRTRTPDYLGPLAGLQFDIVHHGSHWNPANRQSIAHSQLGIRARHHTLTHTQSQRGQNVALLAFRVLHQCNVG